jgi:hypothetical protein
MSDDKSKRGAQDRQRISVEEDYEVRHFAEKHSLPKEKAIEIIKSVNGDRAAADEAAKNYTARI